MKRQGRGATVGLFCRINVGEGALDVCDRPKATRDYEAKFSLQHAVAAGLLLSRVDFEAFGPEARQRCADLATRVQVNAENPWASAYPKSWGGRVRVKLTGGEEYEAARTNAKGDPEAPLSRNDMIAKAEMLLRHGGVAAPAAIVDGILALPLDSPLPDLSLT
jgi:2-methylcitrate dehydratase PrpD